jgi:hypothetical protein
MLRASGKKILWAVNKIDAPTREDRLYDFYPLGVGDQWLCDRDRFGPLCDSGAIFWL